MRIYFSASLHGGVYKAIYRKMVEAMSAMGHKVVADHILNNSADRLDGLAVKDRMDYHRRMSKEIVLCDLAVFEISFPSTISIGHEVTLALDKGKPVVGFYQPGKEPGVLQGVHSDRLMLFEYEPDEIDEVIEYAMEEAGQKIDIRYNFFISPKMTRFLDMVAKDKKTPRSVFLRQLIEKDMKESGYEG